MRMDFSENENGYTLTAEIPGVNKENVRISTEDGMMTIQGEKSMSSETNEENYHRMERSYGSFSRTMALPKDADENNMQAEMKDGVLTLTMPRMEQMESSAKTVEIR